VKRSHTSTNYRPICHTRLTYVIDQAWQREEHLQTHHEVKHHDGLQSSESGSTRDAEKVEKTDVHQKSCIADGHHDERDATNILHLPIELEVAFPAQNLVTPLDDSERRHKNQ